jgi:hypothetical protein
VLGRNRLFFPQAALDRWLSEGTVELSDSELILTARGRRYRLVEAVRVLGLVGGGQDVHEIIGRVKTVAYLRELGAELLGDSMIIGDLAYQVVAGFGASPIGTTADSRVGPGPTQGTEAPRKSGSDEELLAQYLIQNLTMR